MLGGLKRSYRAVTSIASAMIALGLPRTTGFEFVLKTDKRRHSTTDWSVMRRSEGQEKARRMRQIEHGQLTASNGLVDFMRENVKVNSHGVIGHKMRLNGCAR